MTTNKISLGVLPLLISLALLGVSGVGTARAQVSGLVAHWTLDEGSGATAGDVSGNGNAGALVGPTWTAGQMGGALRFDGDYVDVPDAASLDVRFMRTDLITVDPDLSVERLVDDYVYRYYFKTFPVTRNGELLGSVRLETVSGIERERWPWQTVGAVMEPCTEDTVIDPDADASAALDQMQRTGQSRLLVAEGRTLVGVLSLRDLMNFLSVRIDLDTTDHRRTH